MTAPATLFHTTIRVSWADTDAARVVWFGNFLRYVEIAEAALFESLGRPLKTVLEQLQILMPRTSFTISYRSPARFDDVLEVGVGVESVAERRVRYVFEIRQRESRQLVAEGAYEIACVDAATFKSRPIPDEVRALLSQSARHPFR